MRIKQPGTVRIIGGTWRGTRLPVPDLPGLRPTGDRGRETLFNWLQSHIRGACCADLFAGSGVLGLEAASRGASKVFLVEKSKAAAGAIRGSLERLEADQVELVQGDALIWLAHCGPESLDVVFIDPPFGLDLAIQAFEMLVAGNCVRQGGMVYVETARDAPVSVPGAGWEIAKESVMGEVRIRLLIRV